MKIGKAYVRGTKVYRRSKGGLFIDLHGDPGMAGITLTAAEEIDYEILALISSLTGQPLETKCDDKDVLQSVGITLISRNQVGEAARILPRIQG